MEPSVKITKMARIASHTTAGMLIADEDRDCLAAATARMNPVPEKRRITAAEDRVLQWVARGKTNKEIAAILGISPATVKRHMEKILTKLGLRNRVEVAIFGLTVNGCPHQSGGGCTLRSLRPLERSKIHLWAE